MVKVVILEVILPRGHLIGTIISSLVKDYPVTRVETTLNLTSPSMAVDPRSTEAQG